MLTAAFILACVVLWLKSAYFTALPLLPFVPFIALASLKKTLDSALLLAALSGLILDLLSSDPFGIHALASCLTLLALQRMRKLFSSENFNQFGVYSALVSAVFTLIHFLLLFLFDRRLPFCGLWWIADWTLFPLADALYAIGCFYGPFLLFCTIRKHWIVFWLKKKTLSQT